MRIAKINEKEYMFRKFDNVYVGLFFNNGDSIMFDDVGTVFIDSIIKYPNCEKALEYALKFFDNTEQYDVATDFEDFLNELLKLNAIEIEEIL